MGRNTKNVPSTSFFVAADQRQAAIRLFFWSGTVPIRSWTWHTCDILCSSFSIFLIKLRWSNQFSFFKTLASKCILVCSLCTSYGYEMIGTLPFFPFRFLLADIFERHCDGQGLLLTNWGVANSAVDLITSFLVSVQSFQRSGLRVPIECIIAVALPISSIATYCNIQPLL